ncbi:PAS domain S-box protein [Solimicrobium silvestre]|uniref:Virulence sensor protein BvgS n=1 Tax=Solimicrobium silvestre TaxID=2099400 RepID=A0A2S9GZJ5_9BURK|nr:PAS domain S-box protein [Solimicrobium silvestre]PRC93128.1 PAS domain S-box protein [Solimicrobium silvestre]
MKILIPISEYQTHRTLLLGTFGLGIAALLLNSILSLYVGDQTLFINIAWYTGLGISGALFAAIAAYLLLRLDVLKEGSSFNIQIAVALLVMGYLDALHSLQPAGSVFILLHGLSDALGGLLFAAILLPSVLLENKLLRKNLGIFILISIVLLSIAVILFPHRFPEIALGGDLTALLNVGGGCLFLAASVKLLVCFYNNKKSADLYLCLQCVIFGLSAILIEYSTPWNLQWWILHGVRMIGYSAGLLLINSMLNLTMALKTDLDSRLNKKLIRDSDALLATLNDHAIISITDRAGHIIEVNDAFCTISGYSRQELLGKNHRIINSGVQDTAFWRAMWKTISENKSWRGEVCNKDKNNTLYWVDLLIAPFVDEHGQIEKYSAIHTDITASKNATLMLEGTLRDSKALQSTLNMHSIISIANRAGNIIDVNDAFCKISGYSRQELIGKNHRIINSGLQDTAFWMAMWNDISKGIPWHGEVCNRTKKGSLYWVDTVIAPIVDQNGRIEKYISIFNDISASKISALNFESVLRDSTALLSTLNLHSIISIANRAGNIIQVNDAFCRISGYSRQELMGKNHRIVNSGVQSADFWTTMWNSISNGTPWRGEVCNRAKDGSLYWVDTVIAPFVDKDGLIEKYISIRTDISASKNAALNLENALRDSSALLSTLNLHAIVSIANRAGTITEINDAFCKISGYSRQELLGQNHRIVNSGTHPPEFWHDMWRTISVGKPWRGQVCNCAKNGSCYWVDTFIAPFMDEFGQIEKYISIRTDITASKLAEEALRWNESLLQMMSNSSPLAFLVVDIRSDKILYFNLRFCTIWGIEHLADAMRRGELKHNDIAPDCLAVVADPISYTESCWPLQDEYNQIVIEDEILFKNDRVVRRFSTQIRDSADTYFGRFYIFEEVTESKRVERALSSATESEKNALNALRISEERIKFALEGSGDGVWDWDIKQGKVQLSKRWKEMLGYQESDIGDDISEWSSRLHPDDMQRVMADVQKNLDNKSGSFSNEHRMRCKDGQYLWVLDRGMVVQRDSQGAPLRMVGTHTDITTQKQAEDALKQASETALAASLAKSQFLANMSHELRTPMNTVLGMLTLLRKTELSSAQTDYAVKSDTAARSLLDLLNEILDFSKIEAGKMSLDCHSFSLEQLMLNLSDILANSVGEKPLEVMFDIDPTIPGNLFGDAMRLQQVLVNLSSNAIKFTERGQVVVSVSVVRQNSAKVTLKFCVLDSGIGIAFKNQTDIFKGFIQAEASTTRRFGGTGLGLAISQHFVELMGGKIELESSLGHGSRFYFSISLPIINNVDVPEQNQTAPHRRFDVRSNHKQTSPATLTNNTVKRLQGMRVLVAEDNLNNQQVVRELLECEGAIIQIANNGQEVIYAITEAHIPFDLVLMDLQMPVMDGFTATTKIRINLGMQNLPIIAMTANAMASDREACLAAGMNNHVGKPFDLNHLVNILLKHTGRQETVDVEMTQKISIFTSKQVFTKPAIDAAAAANVDLTTAFNRIGNKSDVYLRMLRTFMSDVTLMPEKFHRHLIAGEYNQLRSAFHTLKGLTGALGINSLMTAAGYAELQFGGTLSVSEAESIVKQVCNAISSCSSNLAMLLKALQAMQNETDAVTKRMAGVPKKLSSNELISVLQTMSERLKNSDMAALESMNLLRKNANYGELLSPIDEAINALNFEKAFQLCTSLLENLSK